MMLLLLGSALLLPQGIQASPLATESSSKLGVQAKDGRASLDALVAFATMQKTLPRTVLEDTILNKTISSELLRVLDAKQLRVLRNTAFALGGARFRSDDLKAWFGLQAWYAPSKPASQVTVTPIARQNIRLLKLVEQRYGADSVGVPDDGAFQGYHGQVALFLEECDGECPDETAFVSIETGELIKALPGVSLSPTGRLHFAQAQQGWAPSQAVSAPSGWTAPNCKEKERELNPSGGPTIIDCSTWFDTFVQLTAGEDLRAALRAGLLQHPTATITPSWSCFCAS